jgi:hypothetical protein
MWRHSSTGELVLWTMNGFTATIGQVSTPGTSYSFTMK